MKIATKLVFASFLALSAVAPAFAAEEDTLLEREAYMSNTSAINQHVATKRVQTLRAFEARAYAPAGASVGESVDFGIGSQR